MSSRSYPLKPWPDEAQRRGWCPLSALQTRLQLGILTHRDPCSRRIGAALEPLLASRSVDRKRVAEPEPIPLGASPIADAPLSILTLYFSKRFQLRRLLQT